ncbi:MAG: septation protein A [Gammaproteobacteria bacterium]|jgi:intracellular septation protein|nr:septation protein A [Gammaproteobacteria bacterium]MBT4194633.1 septation protein A [Gammaproteobacteria bacterium]MBT4452109.1 septation protein A [Gammaproteobacteria bacterium]MBT4862336.1 septation protein A [Gammaproteobacteria bacterium]
MKQLFDFFPILLFFIIYKFFLDLPDELILSINNIFPFMNMQPGESKHAIYLATLTAILATIVQVMLTVAMTKRVEKMHIITLVLLLVFGGATLYFKDPLFIKWKPTAINWLFAAVFFGSQFIGNKPLVQRMMGHALEIDDPQVWKKLNLAWIGFFIFSGVANLVVAFNFSEDIWVDFKLFGLMGFTLIFVIGQSFYLARYLPQEGTDPSNKENN